MFLISKAFPAVTEQLRAVYPTAPALLPQACDSVKRDLKPAEPSSAAFLWHRAGTKGHASPSGASLRPSPPKAAGLEIRTSQTPAPPLDSKQTPFQ